MLKSFLAIGVITIGFWTLFAFATSGSVSPDSKPLSAVIEQHQVAIKDLNIAIEKQEQQKQVLEKEISRLKSALDAEHQQLRLEFEERSTKEDSVKISMEKEISNIRNTSKDISNMELVTTVLTCITVLLAILGIFIAIFSFFGYRKIMSAAEDKASEIAENSAEAIVESKLSDSVEQKLLQLFYDGKLNDTLETAILRVTFRGIDKQENELGLNNDD